MSGYASKNLNVKFHKVKSHSGDTFNDLSDDLTNMARLLPPLEINPTRVFDSLMTPTWDSIGPIDWDLRKFARNITECRRVFDEFLNSIA
ncbi:hypothetical protein RIR_jg12853.t1 [Rhizophagus irregularis DAOM 181602=DAOM 197198]|nr:hypothetical protein RIR_jg12853.t1 [Rhizophagus irregularis DAOM 181602=DAOM 197198]